MPVTYNWVRITERSEDHHVYLSRDITDECVYVTDNDDIYAESVFVTNDIEDRHIFVMNQRDLPEHLKYQASDAEQAGDSYNGEGGRYDREHSDGGNNLVKLGFGVIIIGAILYVAVNYGSQMATRNNYSVPPQGTVSNTRLIATVALSAPTTKPILPSPTPPQICPRLETCLTYPQNDNNVQGIVQFKGTATRPNFDYYKFELKREDAKEWIFLARFQQSVTNGTLMEWDTTTIQAGTYQLRLVVVDKTGNYWPQPAEVRVTVNRPDSSGQATLSSVTAKVAARSVNVRATPNTSAKIIGALQKDMVITLIGRTNDSKWFQVKIGTELQLGWISGDTIQIVSGAFDSLPVISPPTQ